MPAGRVLAFQRQQAGAGGVRLEDQARALDRKIAGGGELVDLAAALVQLLQLGAQEAQFLVPALQLGLAGLQLVEETGPIGVDVGGAIRGFSGGPRPLGGDRLAGGQNREARPDDHQALWGIS